MKIDEIKQILDEIEGYKEKVDTSMLETFIERYLKTEDKDVKKFFEKRIKFELKKVRKKYLTAPKNEDRQINQKGADMRIGMIDGKDFFLSPQDFNRNILVTGSVGHGKTNLIAVMLNRLIEKNIKFLIFDMKRDYWSFSLQKDTFFVDLNDIRINPLEVPPGVDPSDWIVHLTDFFAHSLALLIGSRDFLLTAIDSLYRGWNHEYPPSLSDLISFIQFQMPHTEYTAVLVDRLSGLLSVTKLFKCNRGFMFSNLRNNNLVLGMDRLGLSEQRFIVAYFLSFIYFMNINSNKRNVLDRVVVIDDAHNVLDVNQELSKEMGIPLLHTIIAKAREFGIGFVFADQQMSTLLSTSIVNTNMKFIGRVNMVNELSPIFPASMLSEIEEKIMSLGVGEFLLVSSSLNFFPVVKVDKLNIQKDIDKSVLYKKNEAHKELFASFERSPHDTEAAVFLQELISDPFATSGQHIKNLTGKLSKDGFFIFRNELLHDKLIYEVKIKLDAEREAKFLYPDADQAGRIMKIIFGDLNQGQVGEREDFRIMDRKTYVSLLLRRLTKTALRRYRIRFDEDENGLLIKDRKVYITFMHDVMSILKLLETSFSRVIDVISDDVNQVMVINDVLRMNTGQPIGALRVANIRDLESALFN